MHRKTLLGLCGVLGIWITAGLALPFVNVLDKFTPPQLMVFRGFLTATMALIGLRGIIGKVDKYTYLIGLTVPFATLGLFQGIRELGAGPAIIVITATPLVNFVIGFFLGRKISLASIIGMILVISGVAMARWGGHFNAVGFAWIVFATVMNGILYEWFSRAKSALLTRCFFGSVGMGTLGLILSIRTSWAPIAEPQTILLIVGFAFVGGFIYWISNLVTFRNLPVTEASILAQGETPAVILGARFLLGEHLTLIQWIGVGIALYGAYYLSRWLSKQQIPQQQAV